MPIPIAIWLALAAAGTGAAGNALNARAQGNTEDKDRHLSYEQLEAQLEQQRAQTELDRSKFTRDNPGRQMGDAVRGDVLANLQRANFSGEGRNLKRSGGLNPDLLGPNTRMLGDSMNRQAVLSAMGGGGTDGMIEGREDPYRLQKPPLMTPGTPAPMGPVSRPPGNRYDMFEELQKMQGGS